MKPLKELTKAQISYFIQDVEIAYVHFYGKYTLKWLVFFIFCFLGKEYFLLKPLLLLQDF
ncbi:hypothetical protein J32TS2_31450 [Shouchella clausii]|nr:hypothetical protein J32TS2_31450 [Shouchella clausii]